MGETKEPGPEGLSTLALQSQDVIAGLGGAPRELLATFIALFADSTLQQRLKERFAWLKSKVRHGPEPETGADALTSLQALAEAWIGSSYSGDELRVIVWMRLREGLGLTARTFGSVRSTRTAADDLVATTLALVQPGLLEKAKRRLSRGEKKEIPSTLDALARQTMRELVENVFDSKAGDSKAREALIEGVKKQLEGLEPEAKKRLLEAINARELNDEAIRTLLLTGGGLVTLGGAVSLAGFSAYILAAQASAFIPLVSGPALVSFLAVLSNPVTIVLATVGAGVWANKSANEQIQAAIATRIIALLALQGAQAREAGLRTMSRGFAMLESMKGAGGLPVKVLDSYQKDWRSIAPAFEDESPLDHALGRAVDGAPPGKALPDRVRRLVGSEAGQDTVALSALTFGEMLYLSYSLDPRVIAAADFARIEDLSSPAAFAAFARRIDGMADKSRIGAESNLEGYVAEQVVAARLTEQGHVIEFPERSNEAGWDLAVDGVRFQVKNASDLGLLHRHFDAGHDFPVLANSEVAGLLEDARAAGALPEWAGKVHFVEGFSHEGVLDLTREALDAGEGLLQTNLPAYGVTLVAMRQLWRYGRGEVTGSQAVTEALVDGSIGTGLVVAGNYAGVAIGLLVFGPAGAVVLGAALPILARSQVSSTRQAAEWALQGERYRQWSTAARDRLRLLVNCLKQLLAAKEGLVEARRKGVPSGAAGDYLRWRLGDDVCFLREQGLRLQLMAANEQRAIEDAAHDVVAWIPGSSLHPAGFQQELSALMQVMAARPGIAEIASERGGQAMDAMDKGARAVARLLDSLLSKKK